MFVTGSKSASQGFVSLHPKLQLFPKRQAVASAQRGRNSFPGHLTVGLDPNTYPHPHSHPWAGSKQTLNSVSRVRFLNRPARKTLPGWSCTSPGQRVLEHNCPPIFQGGREKLPVSSCPGSPAWWSGSVGIYPDCFAGPRPQANGRLPFGG